MTVKGLSKQKEDDGNCIITQIGDTVKAPEGIVKNEYKQAPMLTLNQLQAKRRRTGSQQAAELLQNGKSGIRANEPKIGRHQQRRT